MHKRGEKGRFPESLSALNQVVLRSLSRGGGGRGATRAAWFIHKGGKGQRLSVLWLPRGNNEDPGGCGARQRVCRGKKQNK